jgi:hypothetical protein
MTAATVGSGANAMIPFESFDSKMCKNILTQNLYSNLFKKYQSITS